MIPSRLEVAKLAKGRLLSAFVADIFATRKREKLSEKARFCSSMAQQDKRLRKMLLVTRAATKYIQNQEEMMHHTPYLKIPKQFPFLCVLLDGKYYCCVSL